MKGELDNLQICGNYLHSCTKVDRKEITSEIRKYSEMKENYNKIYQNLWYAAKAVLRGNFIAMSAYI